MKIKEYSNGKLYISDELEKSASITLKNVNGQQESIVLGEAVDLCKFSKRLESNLKNQVSFLISCRAAGIMPPVNVYELTAVSSGTVADSVLMITGSFDAQMKYYSMFYLPTAESIFEKLFHSKNWNLINAESSIGNVAQKGYGIISLDSFDDLIRRIKNGDYILTKII
jgi:hypothetical protein